MDHLGAVQTSIILTAAGSGYVLFGWLARLVLRKITNGDLVTRREVDAKDREIAHLRATNGELIRQSSLLLGESLPTVAEALKGVRKAAEERSP